METLITDDAKEQLKLEAMIAAQKDMDASYIHIYSEEEIVDKKPFGINTDFLLTINTITGEVSKN